MNKTVRAVISGRVQGVGYRAWTVATASGFELKGWVRNTSDGTVEAVFHGPKEKVLSILEACKKGPPAAHVTKIESFSWDETVEYAPFSARPTV